ncbi:helix-turn-helix domain-containing protein [Massilia sp.]|uniref:helix-turn-helix domain-containing protein n=1 Tax=Massilia sp. TaxID=1882437 RepID=UPI00352D5AD3
MSVEAISWAFQQAVPHASAKFVLVAMANHADADMRCWPSSAHLCGMTSQDRKTVQANLQRLREWGYIVDTGERRGATKQVPVYQLKQPENGPVKASKYHAEVDGNTTENGPVKEAQNRNSSENGTGPNFPPNRPDFPHKQAQISPETGPKTGHGTIRNHQEPSGNQRETRKAPGTRLPKDWMPSFDDARFCAEQRPDLNIDQVADSFRDYWTARAGKDATKVDWPATWRNWVRNERRQQGRTTGYQSANDKAREWAAGITGRNRNERRDEPEFIDLNAPPRFVG